MIEPEPYYDDEIDLRQLLQTLVDGWKIIATVTAAAVVLTGTASFFVIPPTYQAQALVMLNDLKLNAPVEPPALGPETYVTLAESPSFFRKFSEDLGIVGEFRATGRPYSVSVADDKRTLVVTVKDHDPRRAAAMANAAAAELVIHSAAINADNLQGAIDAQLASAQSNLRSLQDLAAKTPRTYALKESLANDPTFTALVWQRLGIRADQAAQLAMTVEVLNPVWQDLQTKITEAQTTIQDLEQERGQIKAAAAQGDELAQAFRSHAKADTLGDGLLKLNQTQLSSLAITSPAVEPLKPVAPRKALNMAVAAVLGVMVGVFAVFFLDFWRRPASAVTAAGETKAGAA
ncbi:MAG: hypothetical protein IRZ18_05540 [Clostridia bacterium]|nr:hypothetical protein [Clostridia bacterium]